MAGLIPASGLETDTTGAIPQDFGGGLIASEYDSGLSEMWLYFNDPINTDFNHQDLLNSLLVYSDSSRFQ